MAREPGLIKALIGLSLKQLSTWVYPSLGHGGSLFVTGPHTSIDYAAETGNGLLSSVVMPVVDWIARAFPEAPLVVREILGDEWELVARHPLVTLVNRPNAYYPGTVLWMATITDWSWFGESYWRILPNRGGQPGELWWLPPWSMDPQWPSDGSQFISHYIYRPDGGVPMRLELEEVLHFRHGLDPWSPRHGLPPLRSIVREIWGDSEATNWIGALLRNMAIPGLIMSPKGAESTLSAEEVDRVKAYLQSRFTGEQRGQPLALGAPTQVDRLSWSPNEMDMTSVRNTAEERVCGALGIPAAVVGFGSGLSNSKVGATMHEFVQLAWNNGLIPLQRLLAAELQRVLMPQFELDTERFQVGWNYDEVAALEPDQTELAKRLDIMVKGGWLKVSEARQAMGYEASDEDDIYLRSPMLQPVDPDDQMPPEPEPVPALPPGRTAPNGNGNGNGQPVEQRALRVKQGSLEEFVSSIIRRNAQRMETPPTKLTRLANRIWREEQKLYPHFERMLTKVLEDYGALVATASREVLQPKQSLEDIMSMAVISERLPLAVVRADLTAIYEQLYESMAAQTLQLMGEAMDLPPTDPGRIQTMLAQQVRDRVALLDLPGESRTNILKVLETARAQNLTEDAMIDLLRDKVPAGRWTSIETRAQILVRSESRFASNLATAEYSRQIGARLLVFDARLGSTDSTCEERNGWIINASEAAALSATEHANGTLSFAPIVNQTSSSVSGAVPGVQ